MIKVCQHCGKEFENRNKKVKYCSRACYYASNIKKIKMICPICGKEFERIPSQEKPYKNHFCSIKCQREFRRLNYSKVEICANCGKEIRVPNHKNNPKHYFCNKDCYYAYKRSFRNEYIIHEKYAEIIVNGGKYGFFNVKIDIEDIDKCKKYNWRIRNMKKGTPYFFAKDNKKNVIHLHRYIMNCPKDKIIDHVNTLDHLDNRKSNLRITDNSTNAINIKNKKNNTSGYKNISYNKIENKWNVHIQKYKKILLNKNFKTLEEAILARDEFIKKNRAIY